jgi:hypothetical protein
MSFEIRQMLNNYLMFVITHFIKRGVNVRDISPLFIILKGVTNEGLRSEDDKG